MPGVPQATDIAKVLPAALAEAGGSFTLVGLLQKLGQASKFKIAGMSSERQVAYLHRTFQEAVELLIRSESVENKDDRIVLTNKGWAQAEALGVQRPRVVDAENPEATDEPLGGVTIDMSQARPFISLKRDDGTLLTGYLRDGAEAFHGRPFVPPASALLDDLYRAEVDGVRSSDGFWTTSREIGVSQNAVELLKQKCHVFLVGYEPESRAPRSDLISHTRRGGRPGRRAGITWERLVCEVIGELGGHADWQTFADAVGQHPLAQQYVSWREECRQALRNHTAPRGRSYFDVAEIGERAVYTLTEQGERLAARRTEDERAPTLSKMIAKAVNPGDDRKLTEYELYALFHLAVELGKPAEAEAIYHRLPENFPDEDRYYMARHLLSRAAELRNGNS